MLLCDCLDPQGMKQIQTVSSVFSGQRDFSVYWREGIWQLCELNVAFQKGELTIS